MTSSPLHILSTRPLGEAVITDAQAKGILIDELEFIRTTPVVNDALTAQVKQLAHQQVVAVFTSMNAVQAVADMLGILQPAWRVGCIGQTTQLLVETLLPNANIIATGKSAGELAQNLLKRLDSSEVYFFCSNIRRDELPQVLQEAGVECHEVVVYETHETPLQLEKPYDAVLFFSPSAVRSFFSVNKLAANTVLFATGITTAAEIKMHSGNTVIVADAPGKQEVVKKLMEWQATKMA